MRFSPIDINTVRPSKKGYKHELNFEEFLGMGVPCVEVLDHHYKTTQVAQQVMGKAARKWTNNVKVVVRSGRVFLVRTDM